MNVNELINKLIKYKEYYTAGYFKAIDEDIYSKFSSAIISCLLNCELTDYEDSYLYPINKRVFFKTEDKIMKYDYSYTFFFSEKHLNEKEFTDDEKNFIKNEMNKIYKGGECIEQKYALAGRGYTHFVPDYDYFIDNSLEDLKEKIYKYNDFHNNSFTNSLVCIINAIEKLVYRVIEHLNTFPMTPKLSRLIESYKKFLTCKAENIYDALVRINFIFNLDNCDNIGKLDTYLSKFNIEDDTHIIIKELYKSMEFVSGWNVVLTENNEHTLLCIDASLNETKPNLSITIKENDDNDKLFEKTTNLLKTNGSIALYNYEAYKNELIKLGICEKDAEMFAFGGCSELMIAGKSNSGSIDAGINMVQVLNDLLVNNTFSSFETLLSDYKKLIENHISIICKQVNHNSELRAKNTPQLIRSILCDGCIETGKDFNNGGAKYNFSVINICSLANAADSLYLIKKVVFENKEYSYEHIKEVLKENKTKQFYNENLKGYVLFGNDNDEVDQIAKEIFDFTCNVIKSNELNRGEKSFFLPACIMFDAVGHIGRMTSASLDGRSDWDCICDSGGAMTGKDKTSPTALINSVAKLKPSQALGTWIVNMRFNNKLLENDNSIRSFKSLINVYFNKGGNQIQVNAINKDLLLKALNDDELASSIIVRVGGFSARFSTLSQDLKLNIIQRTEY